MASGTNRRRGRRQAPSRAPTPDKVRTWARLQTKCEPRRPVSNRRLLQGSRRQQSPPGAEPGSSGATPGAPGIAGSHFVRGHSYSWGSRSYPHRSGVRTPAGATRTVTGPGSTTPGRAAPFWGRNRLQWSLRKKHNTRPAEREWPPRPLRPLSLPRSPTGWWWCRREEMTRGRPALPAALPSDGDGSDGLPTNSVIPALKERRLAPGAPAGASVLAIAEMNLEEYPAFRLGRRSRRTELRYTRTRTDGEGRTLEQVWVVRGVEGLGLPGPFEQDLYVALLVLFTEQGLPAGRADPLHAQPPGAGDGLLQLRPGLRAAGAGPLPPGRGHGAHRARLLPPGGHRAQRGAQRTGGALEPGLPHPGGSARLRAAQLRRGGPARRRGGWGGAGGGPGGAGAAPGAIRRPPGPAPGAELRAALYKGTRRHLLLHPGAPPGQAPLPLPGQGAQREGGLRDRAAGPGGRPGPGVPLPLRRQGWPGRGPR